MTEKEQKLKTLLESFPHDDYNDSPIPNDYENGVSIILIAAREFGWVDRFIRLAEENKGISFRDFSDKVFLPLLPPLEIVDDDEFDEDD